MIAGCVVVIIVVAAILFFLKRMKPKFSKLSVDHLEILQVTINGAGSGEAGNNLVGSHGNIIYPLWVLQNATYNFIHVNLLGKGGFGYVYEICGLDMFKKFVWIYTNGEIKTAKA